MATAGAVEDSASLRALLGDAADVAGLNVACDVDNYDALLAAKLAKTRALFDAAGLHTPDPEVHESERSHFRQRAEFRVWHTGTKGEGGRMFFAMFPKGDKRTAVDIPQFPMGSRRINELMPKVLAFCRARTVMHTRLYEARFLTTLSGDSLITLIYHCKLEDEWREQAEIMAAELGVQLVGRSRKQKVVVGRDYVLEELHVGAKPSPSGVGAEEGSHTYKYRQAEGAFTQPNAGVCQKMLSFAQACTSRPSAEGAAAAEADLCELYCGNGNFTCALAHNFRRVLGTEISRASVMLAQHNLRENGLDNTAVCRMSAQEFGEAMRGERFFERLVHDKVDICSYGFRTLLVDPPRAGLDDGTRAIASMFPTVLYISCNPETMVRDIAAMGGAPPPPPCHATRHRPSRASSTPHGLG